MTFQIVQLTIAAAIKKTLIEAHEVNIPTDGARLSALDAPHWAPLQRPRYAFNSLE